MIFLSRARAFLLGVLDAIDTGTLNFGITWPSTYVDWHGLNNAYDYGANVGEWLWDFAHLNNISRMPWKQRNPWT